VPIRFFNPAAPLTLSPLAVVPPEPITHNMENEMPQVLTIPEISDLNTIVFDAVESSNGDRAAAIAIVLESLAADDALYQSVTERLITTAAKTLVSDRCIKNRKIVFTPPDQSASIKIHAHANRHSMLEGWFFESNGRRLGDATHKDVLAELGLYLARVHTNQVKANLLQLIADNMGKSKKVRNALDEAAIRALQVQAGA